MHVLVHMRAEDFPLCNPRKTCASSKDIALKIHLDRVQFPMDPIYIINPFTFYYEKPNTIEVNIFSQSFYIRNAQNKKSFALVHI